METTWREKAISFLRSLQDPSHGGSRSTPVGPVTLYGTCYSLLGLHYLGVDVCLTEAQQQFILECQDRHTGLLVGPELRNFQTAPGSRHDRAHLELHQTCSLLPFCQQYRVPLASIKAAHRFCDRDYLTAWIAERNWRDAWFEGNNILFVGQLLLYLRDVERHPGASMALKIWFDWLDSTVDRETGLWGTNGFCSAWAAVYGGYHQLLVYYYEDRPLTNPSALVDTVLRLQHRDGGFNPKGNAGACEDVDSTDILVNCYKRFSYRQAEIRVALRRCAKHIISTQNRDGGFPYNRDQPQCHMGIPDTRAAPNVSCAFPTWFRIHTLALIAEVLPDDRLFKGVDLRFNDAFGMGWHESPSGWSQRLTRNQRLAEQYYAFRTLLRPATSGKKSLLRRARRKLSNAFRS